MDNATIARKLNDYAAYLEGEDTNVYRVRAYRRAAETVLAQEQPLTEVVNEKGRAGLEELPGIGRSLAYTIEGLVRTGEFRTLRPDAGRLHRSRLPEPIHGEPSVAALLAIDEEYRRQAEGDTLMRVTPRRFNPEHEPWLPLHVADCDGWRLRALFSNTALAHRLGKTHDWVAIAFHDGFNSGQRTVVTETRGDLRGLRVVRGRERECRLYYQEHAPAPAGPDTAA